jgi:hypothetical protein
MVPKSMWEDNIKMDLRIIGYESVGCIYVAHDTDQWRRTAMHTVMNLRVA